MTKNFYTNVRQYKGHILYRGVHFDENGKPKRVREKIKYEPTIYLKSKEVTGLTNIDGKPVMPVKPGDIWDVWKYIKQYKDVEGFDVYGNLKHEYSYIYENYPDMVPYDKKFILVVNLDIEVMSENGFPDPWECTEEMTAISMTFNDDKIIVLGHDKFGLMPDGYKTDRKNLKYIECESEEHLLRMFLEIWIKNWPDVITGWNSLMFDMPYIVNRIGKILGESYIDMLSPWGVVEYQERVNVEWNTRDKFYSIYGVDQIDYMLAYKKFAPSSKQQENLKLDTVGFNELGMSKLDYSEVKNLHSLYKIDYQKYLDYNVRDIDIVSGLDRKLSLFDLIFALAYTAKVNYEDVFAQVRMWDAIMTNHLMSKGVVVNPMKDSSKDSRYKGAYVKPVLVGMHDYVASFDLDGLYPHLMMGYNISPETFIPVENYNDQMKEFSRENPIITPDKLVNREFDLSTLYPWKVNLTPNGEFFSTNNESFLGEVMRILYDDRKKYKSMMIEELKMLESIKAEKVRRGLE